MKKSTHRSTVLFALLIILVPAALVYLAARLHAVHQEELHEELILRDGKAAIAYVVQANELRVKMPGTPLKTILSIVVPPLPAGYLVREVDAREREKHPWLRDSDFLVQQTVTPYLVVPSAAPPLHIDLTSAAASPAPTPDQAPGAGEPKAP